MNRETLIDKITKLQNQVAGTDIEAEAFAFGAAVQRLMLEHDIEQAEIDAHRIAGTQRKEEPIIKDDIELLAMGISRSGKRNAALEDLCMFVGKAHLCKILIRAGSNWVGLVGTEQHVKVAQLVIATMWRSMNKMADQGLRQAKREGADIHNYTRTFRQAFVWRLQARYQQEQRDIVAEHAVHVQHDITNNTELEQQTIEAGEVSTALAVVNRELERVGSYISSKYRGHARSIGSGGGGNSRAQADGHAAANRVPLRSNAVGSGSRGQLNA